MVFGSLRGGMTLLLLTVRLQLLRLSRSGPSRAFDNDRLFAQQSEICSLKQEEILLVFDQTLDAVYNSVSKCGEHGIGFVSIGVRSCR